MQSFDMYRVWVFCCPDAKIRAIHLSIKMRGFRPSTVCSIAINHRGDFARFSSKGFGVWVVPIWKRLNLIRVEIQHFMHDMSDCGVEYIKGT
ncbi:hypothetical protein TNIN_483231 [Trichonephila inaurata madagascariensis]|uniref:Uncharacterized protein n=1 Tax=Trichonephila inaurata madagascariensis TaxID=2747483 RepID=A0A8X6JEV1_9ARAC|nr:hypothetical protein TNIN_483231 [Trichonephila inaurata madagascariensis]